MSTDPTREKKSHSSRILIDVSERLSIRIIIIGLVLAGLFGWLYVDSGETLSSRQDLVWVLPLIAGLLAYVMLLKTARNVTTSKWRLATRIAGIAGVTFSVILISLFVLDFISIEYDLEFLNTLAFERSLWLYPISLVGISLVMVSFNLIATGTKTDRVVGIPVAMIPFLLTGLVAALERDSSMLAHPFLSERTVMVAYIGFAAMVFISGLKVETFWKSQWPILREKARLLKRRTALISRQVMTNPMGMTGIIILIAFMIIAVVGPYIAPYEVDMSRPGEFERLLPQSSEHWMGTDTFGHDIFSELLYGARTSIIVGITAAMISSILGAAVGLYSGYVGGWKDEVIMRLNDIVLSIPWLVLMIIIAAFMGSIDLTGIILVIGLTGWSGTARLVRAQVLSLRERQYIEKARAIGSSDAHIIRTHILPNSFPLVFANTILTVAISILSEATLSFLGLRPHGVVTWGTMLSYAQTSSAFTIGLHWWIIAPGICIVLVVLGFTLLGYALDDIMNPKLRKR